MTAGTFLQHIEDYYGRYDRPLVKAELYAYIKDMDERFLDRLYTEVTMIHPTQYKKPPDKAIVAKARSKALEGWTPPALSSTQQITDGTDYRDEVARLLGELAAKLRGPYG